MMNGFRYGGTLPRLTDEERQLAKHGTPEQIAEHGYKQIALRYCLGELSEDRWQRHLKDENFRAWLRRKVEAV